MIDDATSHDATTATHRPCDLCPWRIANHGKRTEWGFYKRANLGRLWNQIRSGGRAQSCHPTDPGHPDHIAAGAKPNSQPQECAGAVILVMRECIRMAKLGANGNTIDGDAVDQYIRTSRGTGGLTKSGIMYWVVERQQFAGVPVFGGKPLPKVDMDEPGIGRLE